MAVMVRVKIGPIVRGSERPTGNCSAFQVASGPRAQQDTRTVCTALPLTAGSVARDLRGHFARRSGRALRKLGASPSARLNRAAAGNAAAGSAFRFSGCKPVPRSNVSMPRYPKGNARMIHTAAGHCRNLYININWMDVFRLKTGLGINQTVRLWAQRSVKHAPPRSNAHIVRRANAQLPPLPVGTPAPRPAEPAVHPAGCAVTTGTGCPALYEAMRPMAYRFDGQPSSFAPDTRASLSMGRTDTQST